MTIGSRSLCSNFYQRDFLGPRIDWSPIIVDGIAIATNLSIAIVDIVTTRSRKTRVRARWRRDLDPTKDFET